MVGGDGVEGLEDEACLHAAITAVPLDWSCGQLLETICGEGEGWVKSGGGGERRWVRWEACREGVAGRVDSWVQEQPRGAYLWMILPGNSRCKLDCRGLGHQGKLETHFGSLQHILLLRSGPRSVCCSICYSAYFQMPLRQQLTLNIGKRRRV